MNASHRFGLFSRRLSVVLLCALLGLVSARPAQAEGEPTPVPSLEGESASVERPWAKGVSEEEMRVARELFQQGNELLKESFFKQAIDKYRDALKHWAHPGIHYNLALALINIDAPLEVRAHMLEAIKYGALPLDEKKLEHGKNYLKLIDNQLADFSVSSKQPNTTVVLDGQQVLSAPGTHTTILPPGEHHVTVTRPGYQRRDYDVTLMPGRQQELTVRVFTEEDLIARRRRWSFWMPVAVTTAGAAVTATGFYFMYRHNKKIDDYDAAVAANCDNPEGCAKQKDSLSNLLDTAQTYKTISTIGLAAGAATFTTGAVLLIMNLEKTRRLTPEERDRMALIQPVIGPSTLGVVGTARF